ncbi:MAG: DUF4382 domain-containing protein [Planctomycetota bacterium]
MTGLWKKSGTALVIAIVTVLLFTVSGCFLSGESDTNTGDVGDVTLVVTDVASEQIDRFEVDITQITLTKLSGAVVTTLPRKQRVDFASLSDVSQILAGVTIPQGFYKSAVMTLNFTDATALISGKETPATILNQDGYALTGPLDVEIEFDNNNRPNVVIGANMLLLFDFDLDSSLYVDEILNQVTVVPIMTVSVDPSDTKPINGFGKLTSVNTNKSEFVLELHNPRTEGVIGQYTIATTPSTIFQVDGQLSTGIEGLNALAGLNTGTWVFARGTINTTKLQLTATFVEGGAGVPGNGQDWIEGLIVERTGSAGENAVVKVRGLGYFNDARMFAFNRLFTITTEYNGTAVLRRAASAQITTDYLSVGQRITVYGALTGTDMDATSTAANGRGVIRCIRTDIFGFANSPIENNRLMLDLRRIGLRLAANFEFAEGVDTANFEIDVSLLSAPAVVQGTPLRIRGFVAPVNNMSSSDFIAETIVDRSALPGLLFINWLFPRADVFSSLETDALSVNLSNSFLSFFSKNFQTTSLEKDSTVTIVPKYEKGLYVINKAGINRWFVNFDVFSAAISARLELGERVRRVSAIGTLDEETNELSASIISVVMR